MKTIERLRGWVESMVASFSPSDRATRACSYKLIMLSSFQLPTVYS